MDLDEAREVMRRQHHAVLATRRKDGGPQLSPVSVAVDGEGRVTVSSREGAYKVRNVRRDAHVSLCVLPDGFYGGRWIQVDGTADVLSLPDAMEPLVEYYRVRPTFRVVDGDQTADSVAADLAAAVASVGGGQR